MKNLKVILVCAFLAFLFGVVLNNTSFLGESEHQKKMATKTTNIELKIVKASFRH